MEKTRTRLSHPNSYPTGHNTTGHQCWKAGHVPFQIFHTQINTFYTIDEIICQEYYFGQNSTVAEFRGQDPHSST